MTLTDFLLARIAEDDAGARGALSHCPSPWARSEPKYSSVAGHLAAADGTVVAIAAPVRQYYFTQWQPIRVVAECEAKRRIVELHRPRQTQIHFYCVDCAGDPPCTTLRLLALPYADHPDYREEWRA